MLEIEKSIIIISTTISICIMLLTGVDKEEKVMKNYKNTKNQTQVMIDKPKNINSSSRAVGNLDERKIINNSKNKEGSVAPKETEKPIEESNNIESSKALEDNNKNESDASPISEEILKRDEDTEKTTAVFKVNREDIFSELSFTDKEKLLLISTKVKASDYKKISNLLKGDVDGQGVLSSLKILKEKLSKNDYSKIKQIFNKFINMDLVDN